jgi:diguanylate cyclase (GGDEF)-like protein
MADPGAFDTPRAVPRPLMLVNGILAPIRRPALTAICLVMLGAIFVGDVLTGPEWASSALYLIPVAIGAWYLHGAWAAVVVTLAAASWLYADHLTGRTYVNELAEYWNAVMRVGPIIVTAYTLRALRIVLEHERELARTDPLTGLANRRSFIEMANHELARSARSGQPLTLAILDIDRFKAVNDARGHVAGDALLRDVGRVLNSTTREGDVVARLGGDEFAILLPEVDPLGAEVALDRLLRALNDLAIRGGWGTGFSLGAATTGAAPAPLEQLLRQADAALYDAKARGGNCIAMGAVHAGG